MAFVLLAVEAAVPLHAVYGDGLAQVFHLFPSSVTFVTPKFRKGYHTTKVEKGQEWINCTVLWKIFVDIVVRL